MTRLLALPAFAALLGLSACTEEGPDPCDTTDRVALTGVAFQFGTENVPLAGARLTLAECPGISTVTDASGLYSLAVPRGLPVTPYIEYEDFPVMHLETWAATESLTDVNFQTVPPLFYEIFSGLLTEAPDPARCQVASTVNVAAVKGLTLEEFLAYGPHGVAGATVTIEPPVDPRRGPVYFDERTLPDRDLTETTIDGGVVFANLEPGVYTLRAHHPTRSFREVTVTCVAGRFINAGPPWGLHEIAP